jgi:hypothetical protein
MSVSRGFGVEQERKGEKKKKKQQQLLQLQRAASCTSSIFLSQRLNSFTTDWFFLQQRSTKST